MKKRFFYKIYFLIAGILVSVIVIAGFQISAYCYNQRLDSAFVQKQPDNVYTRQEELTKDTLLRVTPLSRTITEQGAEEIKLDATICYYEKSGDWIPKKIFWRGTKVMTCVGYMTDAYKEIRETYEEIYGWNFYPSYQRGWRVAIPFITKEEWQKGIEPEYKLCYIWTGDVKKLERAWLDRYGKVLKKEGVARKDWYLRSDKRLYEKGYYLSPDLYRSYFPLPVKVIMLGWIAAIGWTLFQRIKSEVLY
ncbi:MAG: hypothetical protein HFI40_14410 [Lachnospiraceae bacterium]|jgi:hypothetical protein|nr:hypothetical protein [Lachnospiraceae bacterium]